MIERKLILADVREGDFTHPGEIEAVDMVLKILSNNHKSEVLDVGCGLGGTLQYMQNIGYQDLIGIDNDSKVIDYAKEHYSTIQFINADIHNIEYDLFSKKFNIITLFSSFYCFKNQQNALINLNKLAAQSSQLTIFDYSALNKYAGENPFDDDHTKPFYPIFLDSISEMLLNAGWNLLSITDLTTKFMIWYIYLLQRLESKRSILIDLYGQKPYDIVCHRFTTLLHYINNKKIGGALIHAEKI